MSQMPQPTNTLTREQLLAIVQPFAQRAARVAIVTQSRNGGHQNIAVGAIIGLSDRFLIIEHAARRDSVVLPADCIISITEVRP